MIIYCENHKEHTTTHTHIHCVYKMQSVSVTSKDAYTILTFKVKRKSEGH
jgi:hypothetical protein